MVTYRLCNERTGFGFLDARVPKKMAEGCWDSFFLLKKCHLHDGFLLHYFFFFFFGGGGGGGQNLQNLRDEDMGVNTIITIYN